MIDRKVWAYVKAGDLTAEQRKRVIRSHMFLKDKYTSEGVFDKVKARLVAGGDQQDKSLYDNLSSPTVSLEAVLTTIAVAAVERRHMATVDITGAYLEVVLPADDEIYMTLDPITARILAQMDAAAVPAVGKNGDHGEASQGAVRMCAVCPPLV